MESTDPNVLPTSSPVLQHTRNTNGDLGSFVNPYECSCHTCCEVVEERRRKKTDKEIVPTLPPGPPLRRVNAFTDALGRTRIQPEVQEELLEADAMAKLLSLRRQLLKRKDEVTDEKRLRTEQNIQAVETILRNFGIDIT
jgi:hypothetical protein